MATALPGTTVPARADGRARAHYMGKRLLDWAVLVVAALPVLVICAVCAVAVRLSSPGPILFHQTRVGRHGQHFELLKFRTMLIGDNPLVPDPDRTTGVGKWLRRLSLDELPQLLNVAKGDMSIVGPRPTLAYQVARYDDRQRGRLAVRPGLTGLAQVSGRNHLTWADKIELDLAYVDRQSLGTDVGILLRSIVPVLRSTGVDGHPLDDPLAAAPTEADSKG